MNIGEKIKDLRQASNMSQSELAEKLYLSKQAIGKWERGESLPDIVTLIKIARIFNVDLNYFDEPQIEVLLNPFGLASWVKADFSGISNIDPKLNSANINSSKFKDANLSSLSIKSNNLVKNDFTNANFSKSQFSTSNLFKNNFNKAKMNEVSFSFSNLTENDFSDVDFHHAVFKHTTFTANKIINSKFHFVNFTWTCFKKIEFTTPLKDCSFVNCRFVKTTFKDTKLVNVFFKGNLKKLKVINCQLDHLTYQLLVQGKAEIIDPHLIDREK